MADETVRAPHESFPRLEFGHETESTAAIAPSPPVWSRPHKRRRVDTHTETASASNNPTPPGPTAEESFRSLVPPSNSVAVIDSRRSSMNESMFPRISHHSASPKERFRAIALTIAVFQKLLRATFRKPSNICEACKRLELAHDKFIIQDHSFDRNQQAYRSYFPVKQRSISSFSLGNRAGKMSLGTVSEIRGRSVAPTKCPFCYLVVCSLKYYYPELTNRPDLDRNLTCEVSWAVDGREILKNDESNDETRARTRRIRLHWSADAIPDAYIVLVAPEALYRYGPSERSWDIDSLFLGRYIKTAAKNTNLIRSWLNLCDDNHGALCYGRHSSKFEEMTLKSYFGVIDVHEMRIKPLPKGARFVALSYVWGKGSRYRTTLQNVESHCQPGGLEKVANQFPRVILDSLGLVRSLGERYLWVDSLCIVQDSQESWALNSSNMDQVYGNAYFTICAADGANAKDPLRAISPRERKVKQYMEECAEDLTLMVSHLAETYINRSDWDTRAWTFQERLLSKRCLLFAEGRVFFQCRSNAMSEDVVSEKNTACWSIELLQAPLQLLRDIESRAFYVYKTSVGLYTKRILTRAKDILAAYNGLSNLLGESLGSPLVFGLPSSHFDLALLWQPAAALRRREPRNDAEKADYGKAVFPSWSWCGWMGENESGKRVPGVIYDDEFMLQGCFSNVHQWLLEHTWIAWHIRDRHGNLRPIWNADSCAKPENKIELRWRGYGFPNALGGSATAHCDSWGTKLPENIRDRPRNSFRRTLPHYPYGISLSDSSTPQFLPNTDKVYLQFWTWSAVLKLFPTGPATSMTENRLHRFDITDYTGDWCGTIQLDESWLSAKKVEAGAEFEFIAISEAKNFSTEENDNWTYYIPKERNQSDWDLYFVLLVEHTRGIGHRVGLGKVFKEAFSNSCLPGKEWKEFILE